MVRDRAGVKPLRRPPEARCIVNERPRTTELQRAAAGEGGARLERRAGGGTAGAGAQQAREGLRPSQGARGLAEVREGERRRDGGGEGCVLSL